MRVIPIADKIIIKPMEPESVTAGGIVLPDSAQERPSEGRVLSVGDGQVTPDGHRVPPQVVEGDHVIYSRYSGNEVSVDGDDLIIVSERDIQAVIG